MIEQPPTRLFRGGPILTMERQRPRVEALLTRGDRIVALGELAAVRAVAEDAEEFDLRGAALLPGFIDAHHHFSEGALLTSGVNLHWPEVLSVAEILERVRQRAQQSAPGDWIIGEGYDERQLIERRAPTLAELDRVAPSNPVLLVQFSYHEVVVNTAAHKGLGLALDRPDPRGGEIARDGGNITGRMIENATAPFYMGAIRQLVTQDRLEYFAALERYQRRLFQAGITRVYDPAVSPLMEELLQAAATIGVLRMPVWMMRSSADGMFMPPRDRLAGPPTGEGSALLQAGPLKLFMDGGIRCAMKMPLSTAIAAGAAALWRAMKHRSLDSLRLATMTPVELDRSSWSIRSGMLFYDETEARSLVNEAIGHGLTLAVHAEGNVAIEQTLRVLPRASSQRAAGVPPHRIEHFFLPDPHSIVQAAELGVAVATQPTIAEWTGAQLLDAGVIGRHLFVPLRRLLDAGVLVAGSSDAPVVDFDPIRGISAAVTRRTAAGEPLNDGEEITLTEALELYTINAARSAGLEHEVGTLAAGKRADMVLLSKDPMTGGRDLPSAIRVIRTVSAGRDVFVDLTWPPA